MAQLLPRQRGPLARVKDERDEWSDHGGLDSPDVRRAVGVVVAIGLFAWAAYTLGPELRRYLKIRSM